MKKILAAIILLSATGCISISTARHLQPYRENIIRNGNDSKILVIHIDGIISDSVSSGNPFNSAEKIPMTASIKEQLDCAERQKHKSSDTYDRFSRRRSHYLRHYSS